MLFRVLSLMTLSLSIAALWPTNLLPGGDACRRAAEQQAAAREFDYENEIFFAVLEGCFVDGASNTAVDTMLATDPQSGLPANFIKGCAICMPARDALRVYRARPDFEGRKIETNTLGAGLDASTLAGLASPDLVVRQTQIMKLVEKWLARRVDNLRLNDYELKQWQTSMAERRKKGLALLQQYQNDGIAGTYAQMKACPFCDAANGACGNQR